MKSKLHLTQSFNYYLIFLISFTLFIMACSKNDTAIEDEITHVNEISSPVMLTDLQDGQSSTYVRYESNCINGTTDFRYTGDTLILSVVEEQGQLFFEERLTSHSSLANNEVIKHTVYGDGQRVLIPERFDSYLFFFFGNDTIPVLESYSTTLKQKDCLLFEDQTVFTGNDIGQLEQFEIGDILLTDKRAVSCVPNLLNIDAYLIYDDEQLFHSYIAPREFGTSASSIGWRLIDSDNF